MSSFTNIDWLPEAGLKPDQKFYFLDSIAEKIEITLSTGEQYAGQTQIKLSKEKLAEIVVMTKKGRPEKAKIALQYYFDYLNKALAEQNNEDASPKDKNHLKFLNAILEHRYILGIEYTELSEHAAHEIIEQTNANLMLLYKQIEVQIPVSLTDSLFFKKDEVNWIWEIANENKVRFKTLD